MTKINVDECDDNTKRAAEVFYRRYCENADNKNYRGEECPAFADVGPKVQSHWCAVAMLASSGAVATIRSYVWSRLDHMATRPEMWATTQESLGVQLVMLAEFVSFTQTAEPSNISFTSELTHRLYGPGNVVPAKPIDAAWAAEAVAKTKAFLEEKCGKAPTR